MHVKNSKSYTKARSSSYLHLLSATLCILFLKKKKRKMLQSVCFPPFTLRPWLLGDNVLELKTPNNTNL